jgi:hypothetical protein
MRGWLPVTAAGLLAGPLTGPNGEWGTASLRAPVGPGRNPHPRPGPGPGMNAQAQPQPPRTP